MRNCLIASALLLAACSEGDAGQNTAKAEPAAGLEPGQWETTVEVLDNVKADEEAPRLTLAKGDKVTVRACIEAGQGKNPPAILLAGLENGDCTADNSYVSRGRLTATLSCNREGLSGKVMVSSEGTFTGPAFEANATMRTQLVTSGDSVVTAKLSGRRTGECTAAPAAAG